MQNVTQPQPGEKKLLEQVRDAIRAKHYSLRTEKTYIDWIRRYIIHHGKKHHDLHLHPELVEGHVLQRGGLAVRSPLDD